MHSLLNQHRLSPCQLRTYSATKKYSTYAHEIIEAKKKINGKLKASTSKNEEQKLLPMEIMQRCIAVNYFRKKGSILNVQVGSNTHL